MPPGQTDPARMSLHPAAIPLALASALVAVLVTRLSIHYALRRSLVDLPGQRRSHSVPTPRGGGIGIVAGVVTGLAIGASTRQLASPACVYAIVAVVLVAAVGWIDDHRGLSARIRIIVHALAMVVLYVPLFQLAAAMSQLLPAGAGNPDLLATASVTALAAVVFVLANVWSVNLHNFMDGINGLLACQAIFVFLVLAALAPEGGQLIPLLCAAATAGFLPSNFPRARVFMGDVGSGSLGLLIAWAVVLQAVSFHGSGFSGLIVCSAFVADATCTLLSRMLRGRRWYSAHREHLYQWLVRSGFSHARVVALYMGWNLFVVVPVLVAVNRGVGSESKIGGLAWTLAVYALALVVWIAGKRWCLRRAKNARREKA